MARLTPESRPYARCAIPMPLLFLRDGSSSNVFISSVFTHTREACLQLERYLILRPLLRPLQRLAQRYKSSVPGPFRPTMEQGRVLVPTPYHVWSGSGPIRKLMHEYRSCTMFLLPHV